MHKYRNQYKIMDDINNTRINLIHKELTKDTHNDKHNELNK